MKNTPEHRFEFGANWAEFVNKNLSQERVEISRRHMLDFLGRDSLSGMSFLDIGCGSGLHSLAAFQAGARHIHSFDYDPNSVETTQRLHKIAHAPTTWEVMQGSVLDEAFMTSLPQTNVVSLMGSAASHRGCLGGPTLGWWSRCTRWSFVHCALFGRRTD